LSAPAELTLICPGLLAAPLPAPAGELARLLEGVDLGATEWLLARARAEAGAGTASAEQLAFAAFGIEAGEAAPVAAVTRVLDGGDPRDRRWWLRLDPVHVAPGVASVRVVGGAALALGEEEAAALLAEVNRELAAEGVALEAPVAERWYCASERDWRIRASAPWRVRGGGEGLIAAGEDATRWQALANLAAMALAASEVNARREARGALPVNALWPWGGGRLPEIPAAPPWRRVWSDGATALGLAALAGVERGAESGELAAAAAAGGALLVVLEGAERCIEGGDVEGWREFLAALERDWLAPARALLGGGALAALTVECGSRRLRLGRGARWRFWRRARPLACWLEAGEGGLEGQE